MKCLLVLMVVAAASRAQVILSPLGHLASPLALRTQYHAQNELGQWSFGHAGGPNSRVEASSGGVTQGGFSYVDAHGLVQSRNYVADPLNGFRVAGTDIPVDSNTPLALSAAGVTPVAGVASHPLAILGRKRRQAVWPLGVVSPLGIAHPSAVLPQESPEVAVAKAAHLIQYNNEAVRNAGLPWGVLGRRKRSVLAYSAPLGVVSPVSPWSVPLAHAAAPLAVPVAHAAPLAVAAHPSAVLPQESPEVAVAKAAHLIQYNNEAVRNAGVPWGVLGRRKRSVLAYSAPLGVVSPVSPWSVPLAHAAAPLAVPVAHAAPLAVAAHPSAVLPQESPVVAAAKAAHLIQYNNEAVRNAGLPWGVLGRRKRSVLAYSAPLGVVSPVSPWSVPLAHAAAPLAVPVAHPLTALPQDTPEVAIAKNAHLIQYNNELVRNAHLSPVTVLGK